MVKERKGLLSESNLYSVGCEGALKTRVGVITIIIFTKLNNFVNKLGKLSCYVILQLKMMSFIYKNSHICVHFQKKLGNTFFSSLFNSVQNEEYHWGLNSCAKNRKMDLLTIIKEYKE